MISFDVDPYRVHTLSIGNSHNELKGYWGIQIYRKDEITGKFTPISSKDHEVFLASYDPHQIDITGKMDITPLFFDIPL
jgi:hypothetical protein